jgi:MFS family permease
VIVVPQIATLPKVTGDGLGYSVTTTGLLLVPIALSSIVGAWVAGRFVDVIGPRAHGRRLDSRARGLSASSPAPASSAPLPAESGYTDGFVLGAIASGCAMLAAALLPGRR